MPPMASFVDYLFGRFAPYQDAAFLLAVAGLVALVAAILDSVTTRLRLKALERKVAELERERA